MRARALVGALGVVVVSASCGGGSAASAKKAAPQPHVGAIPSSALPASLDGLALQSESDRTVLTNTAGTYASAVGFWSLRQKHLVEATLEILKLSPTAPQTIGFQTSLVNQITGGLPTEVRLSGHTVYLATGLGSGTSTWFDGSYLYILTTRSQFATPRSLLEAGLAMHIS